MVNIAPAEARGLLVLRSPEMAPFVGYLRRCLQTALDTLTHADDPVLLHRAQGESTFVSGLLSLIDQAPDIVSRIDANRAKSASAPR
ncbi:MAG: hypothetical protein LBD70_07935 [Bifidobacteriaceae bacterium]|jgi:hypothetical protein|nr:hypothetical protein [Bifidobacteriaceae bacterium]